MHRLTRRLLRARDASGVVAAIEASLREDFGASRWVLVLTDLSLTALAALQNPHVRVVPKGSAELKIFETFFESGRPRSGQIRDTQRDYLFGGEGTHRRLHGAGSARRARLARPARDREPRHRALPADHEHGLPGPASAKSSPRRSRPGAHERGARQAASNASCRACATNGGCRRTPQAPTRATSTPCSRTATRKASIAWTGSTRSTCACSPRRAIGAGSRRAACSAGSRRCAASSAT